MGPFTNGQTDCFTQLGIKWRMDEDNNVPKATAALSAQSHALFPMKLRARVSNASFLLMRSIWMALMDRRRNSSFCSGRGTAVLKSVSLYCIILMAAHHESRTSLLLECGKLLEEVSMLTDYCIMVIWVTSK